MFLNTHSLNNTNIRSGLHIINKFDIINKEWINDIIQMKKVLHDTYKPTQTIFFL